MKNYLLVLLLCVAGSSAFAQVTFDPAYFIKNNNDTIHCLIRNRDWRNSPTDFEYKLNENSAVEIASAAEVMEFQVEGSYKYVSYMGDINLYKQNQSNYTTTAEMQLATTQVFLKVLQEGKASLWVFEKNGQNQYVMQLEGQAPELLLYKTYLDGRIEHEVNTFRMQLYRKLASEQLVQDEYFKISYTKNDLVRLFEKYNSLSGGQSVSYAKEKSKGRLSLSLVGMGSLMEEEIFFGNDSYLGKRQANGYALGVQLEEVFPFNRNKWSVVLEANFAVHKSEHSSFVNTRTYSYRFDSKTTNLLVAPRYYAFLNQKNSRIYLGPIIGYKVQSGSSLLVGKTEMDLTGSFMYGCELGYRQNRWSVGARGIKVLNELNNFIGQALVQSQLLVVCTYSIWN